MRQDAQRCGSMRLIESRTKMESDGVRYNATFYYIPDIGFFILSRI
jgi:hypothetical protein